MISDNYKANFNTLCLAVKNGDVLIMEAYDKVLKETVIVVCAVNFVDGMYQVVPFAQLYEFNPCERLIPAIERADGTNDASEAAGKRNAASN